jgi:glycosyltransferase involved in cell wall biosynthesis
MRYTLPVASCAMVHTVHNVALREVDAIGRLIHRIGYKRGVIPVAVAEEVARTFRQTYGFEPATIHNGIDTSRYQRAPKSSPDVIIISVARLEPQKNPELLVDAFKRLPERTRLLLVGDGSLRPSWPRVELLGARTDIPELLAQADIFALASDWEGHPIAVMEAMAAGLPVVATAVGGVPEIVGDAGILVPPRDVDALHSELAALVADPARRTELSHRARERAKRFDVAHMVSAYEDLFTQAVLA